MKILLGSQSTTREEVLQQIADELGATYEMQASNINEKSIRDSDPSQLVLKLARAKADAIVAATQPDADVLITADQVVVWEGQIREKPESEDQARQFMRDYSESEVSIVSGVIARNLKSNQVAEDVDVATVRFRTLPGEVIEAMIAYEDVMSCGGALRAQNPRLKPYELFSDLSDDQAVGLPKTMTIRLIKQVQSEEVSA